jgi:hypothetical protein
MVTETNPPPVLNGEFVLYEAFGLGLDLDLRRASPC